MTDLPSLSHPDYTVGWICALPIEMAAAQGMLDEHHSTLRSRQHDTNNYACGRIGDHNVVIACLPSGVTGTISAARLAAQMLSTFTGLRFGLMVGIGGGVPSDKNDIRLGDVVVSKPTGAFGGVIQYDFGKTVQDGKFMVTGSLNKPPEMLLTALAHLEAKHMMEGHKLANCLSEMMRKYPRMVTQFAHPGTDHDLLYEAEYDHPRGQATCLQCEGSRLVARQPRPSGDPAIHYGLIASGDQVMRHGATRDRLRRELDILCFEMEAAGLMDTFPCLVIRGICDYADSHKNKRWQAYAAAAAAAYAKELLLTIPGSQVMETRMATETTALSASLRLANPLFLVPFERDKRFVGREDILLQMQEEFQSQHRVALYGLGGIGKSQIAIEYAYRFRDHNPKSHVFWVYAANDTRFDQAYKEIGRKLKLPRADDLDVDVCELVSDWLNDDDDNELWLMILDNADNSDLFFQPVGHNADRQARITKKPLINYLPKKLSSKRSLLITTRNRQLGEDLSNGDPSIEVLPFSLQEARTLLLSQGGSIAEEWTISDCDSLLEVLGYIPLAITQAAAFVRRNRMSLRRYLESLEKDEHNIKDYLSTELQDSRRERGIPNSVFRTWKVSFDQIREQDLLSATMLSVMAILDRQQIPEFLLRDLSKTDVEFFSAVGILDSLSLIKKIRSDRFAIHRLVQLSVHMWLEQHGQRELYEEKALVLVAQNFPGGDFENWDRCESLLPHAQAVLRYSCNTMPRSRLLYTLSWFESKQGRDNMAYEKAFEACSIAEKELGAENVLTLRRLDNLARILQRQGKYEEAAKMHQQVLKGREKVLGVEHPTTLTSLDNLAKVLRYQGNYEEAEKMHQRALKGTEKILGVEHPETLMSLFNLATVLQLQGKYEEAEKMNRQAWQGSKKILGEEHPYTLINLDSLAVILQYQAKYEEAEKMHQQALKGRKKILGEEHPETLISLFNLARVLQLQRKYEDAEKMDRQALQGREKILGAEHPDTLASVHYLANLYQAMGQYPSASDLYQRAIAGYKKTLGSQHPSTVACLEDYSSLQDEVNRSRLS